MKRLIVSLAAAFFALSAAATTLNPVQLLNPAGSSSGQAILSTGASTAPAWGNVTAATLAAQAANTVLANVTASSASPTAVALPSCSAANSALKYTSATGFSCGTTYALTSATLAQFAATTSAQLLGIISDETGSGSLVFGTSPTIGTPTISGGTINSASVGATTPSTGAFTTLSATGNFTPSQTNGIVGTTTNNNANAGSVGEYVTNSTTGTALTTATSANATSVSLTAGDWDVQGTATYTPAGTTVPSQYITSISTTSATLGGANIGAREKIQMTGLTGANGVMDRPTPVVRVSLSATTTVFLVVNATFTTSTLSVDGFIRARRVR